MQSALSSNIDKPERKENGEGSMVYCSDVYSTLSYSLSLYSLISKNHSLETIINLINTKVYVQQATPHEETPPFPDSLEQPARPSDGEASA